jgi:ABC-type sugar transport system permease subunit
VERIVGAVQDHWFSYLLFLPTLIYLVFLLWIPFFRGVWMSLHEWASGGANPTWVGLDNYIYLLNWDPFYQSLQATLGFGVATFFQLILAVAAACLGANLDKFKAVVSTGLIIPYTMPPVATGTLWVFLLKPNLGPIFTLLTDWGILQDPIYWSTQGDMALLVVTLVNAWTFWPFMFLILFATLVSIPDEYYESARVYGASRWQTFWYVTLPQLKTSIFVVVTLRLVWNLTKVSQPLQMTGGGPGYQTSPLSLLLYRSAFSDGNLGEAFAVGIIFLLLVLAFIVLFIRYFEKSEGDQL